MVPADKPPSRTHAEAGSDSLEGVPGLEERTGARVKSIYVTLKLRGANVVTGLAKLVLGESFKAACES
jgi:hypothetical protein